MADRIYLHDATSGSQWAQSCAMLEVPQCWLVRHGTQLGRNHTDYQACSFTETTPTSQTNVTNLTNLTNRPTVSNPQKVPWEHCKRRSSPVKPGIHQGVTVVSSVDPGLFVLSPSHLFTRISLLFTVDKIIPVMNHH